MSKKLKILIFIIGCAVLSWLYLSYDAGSLYIVSKVRVPRFVLTLFSGFVLGAVGTVFQAMLNNPLAEPYILGVSSGSALFSTIAAVSGLFWLMPIFGFAGALLTILIVWTLAHLGGFFDKTKLLLSGIIIGLFFSSVISLLIYLNQEDISSILNILLGNLGKIFSTNEWYAFLVVFFISIFCIIYLFGFSKELNVLTAGDLVAQSLGVDVKKLRKKLFFISSLLTGVTVAYVGIIGFVGLIVPHMIRMIFGYDNKKVLIWSAFGGAFFLLFCDFLSMHLTVLEIPVGVITSFIGAPFFIYLMMKEKN